MIRERRPRPFTADYTENVFTPGDWCPSFFSFFSPPFKVRASIKRWIRNLSTVSEFSDESPSPTLLLGAWSFYPSTPSPVSFPGVTVMRIFHTEVLYMCGNRVHVTMDIFSSESIISHLSISVMFFCFCVGFDRWKIVRFRLSTCIRESVDKLVRAC